VTGRWRDPQPAILEAGGWLQTLVLAALLALLCILVGMGLGSL
jgi:hypothetical protein